MSTLLRLRSKVGIVLAEFFELSRRAEERRDIETRAAVVITSYVRGFLIRRRILRLTAVVLVIQRYWRGYLGRLRAKQAGEVRDKRSRQEYFYSRATTIQRHWRGFWSRKHLFDFYARKAYLRALKEKNEVVRAELEVEARRAGEEQRQLADEAARKLFDQRIGKLHHLVSTAAQPGIFASPYQMATGTVPLVAGKPVEHHLKASFKAQAPQLLPPIRKPSPGGLASRTDKTSTGTLGGFHPPEVTLPTGAKVAPHITLRQSAAYDAVKEARRLEEMVQRSEMLSVHPLGTFTSSSKAPFYPPIDPQSNRNMERFSEGCIDPTMGVKSDGSFAYSTLKIAPVNFNTHIKRQGFFDPVLNKEDGML